MQQDDERKRSIRVPGSPQRDVGAATKRWFMTEEQMPGPSKLPQYFRYYDRPVKILDGGDGGLIAWAVDQDTGAWVDANELIFEILFATSGEDVYRLSRSQFISAVERYRGERLRGEEAIFALYDTVNALVDTVTQEGRQYTPEETALIAGIRRRTYKTFEVELRRKGNPAADPEL